MEDIDSIRWMGGLSEGRNVGAVETQSRRYVNSLLNEDDIAKFLVPVALQHVIEKRDRGILGAWLDPNSYSYLGTHVLARVSIGGR
jgi:hypothetical protein